MMHITKKSTIPKNNFNLIDEKKFTRSIENEFIKKCDGYPI